MSGDGLTRRGAIGVGGALALAGPASAAARRVPKVDTHIHLFDPNRPQGAPYRGPRTAPFYTAGSLPATFRRIMARHDAVAAIHVDASPWVEDNLWVLQVAQADPVMVGVIGNLRIEATDFPELFARHAKNPLLLGLRYGNLWRYDLVEQSRRPAFIDNLKLVADANLTLDTANPRIDLLQAVLRVNDRLPGLRIVIDHLPKLDPTPEQWPEYRTLLAEIAARPALFVKLSSSIRAGHTSPRLAEHRERLDLLFDTFGPARVLYASDWPNVEGDGPVDAAIDILDAYFAAKPEAVRDAFFWKNSIAAYRWRPRNAAQTALTRRA